jgi:TPP-dependent pyruvate/acetoin dehydrogenase alpha subunit
VVAGVFRAPEGIRLGPPYRPAPAPQQAREARRRDAVAAIREELLRAGLSVEELLAALRGAETAAEEATEEAAAAPPTEMAAGEPAAEPADDTAAEGVTTAAAGWRRR